MYNAPPTATEVDYPYFESDWVTDHPDSPAGDRLTPAASTDRQEH